MKVSLKLIKKYVDLPNIDINTIATDLTLKTVEVENVINTKDKFHDIVVGKILEVKDHPNADSLKVCMVDINEGDPVQIVCGGNNLYADELVVVSKPGSEVYWHGTGDLVKIGKTKMRGEDSYGMICGASEVYLDTLFPPKDDHEIVDLSKLDLNVGDNIADALNLEDTILEIDNKSLSNRPDLWGHYGIARELSVIYNVPLKELPKFDVDKNLPAYDVEIKNTDKCHRYAGIEIDNVAIIDSPMEIKNTLVNCGLRPINAIVDITNYVMIAVGQPTHAFDKTHVHNNKIIVRDAKQGEKLLLLDDNEIELDSSDLVIADEENALALAGIKGGKKDSILDTTTSVLLEVANFSATAIRKTGKKLVDKSDAQMRYEKGLDTHRVEEGINLALTLFKQIFPDCKIVKYTDNYPVQDNVIEIDVPQKFLDERLGKVLDSNIVSTILTGLGYNVKYENNIYHVIVPTYRATGDVTVKDDVMGDLVRILGFNSFEAKPLEIRHTHAIIQNKYLLERRLREYLANRCGFNEIITYPWIDEKYINASGLDKDVCVRLATPPAPELAYLHSSLIPGILESISKNLRYFDDFKIFEMNQVFEKGEYHESSEDETLPIHKKYLTGAVVCKDARKAFFDLKGVLENISSYTHMENITLKIGNKPSWADINAHLDICLNDEKIGSMGLVSVRTMSESKIKRVNVAMFELNVDKLVPFTSRTNTYHALSQFPLVEKDLSIIVDENISWENISMYISKKVKELEFVDEYTGSQIPDGKKSISFRFKLGKEDGTLSSEEINDSMNAIVKTLGKTCGATLREE